MLCALLLLCAVTCATPFTHSPQLPCRMVTYLPSQWLLFRSRAVQKRRQPRPLFTGSSANDGLRRSTRLLVAMPPDACLLAAPRLSGTGNPHSIQHLTTQPPGREMTTLRSLSWAQAGHTHRLLSGCMGTQATRRKAGSVLLPSSACRGVSSFCLSQPPGHAEQGRHMDRTRREVMSCWSIHEAGMMIATMPSRVVVKVKTCGMQSKWCTTSLIARLSLGCSQCMWLWAALGRVQQWRCWPRSLTPGNSQARHLLQNISRHRCSDLHAAHGVRG